MLTSKLTKRAQTTLPRAVQAALALDAGDRVGYVIEGDTVRLVNAAHHGAHADPVLDAFLTFLDADLHAHPERVALFPPTLLERAHAAVTGVAVDHDAPLDGADPL